MRRAASRCSFLAFSTFLELRRHTLLLLESFASEGLVTALEGQLGALVPSLRVRAKVVGLLAELLLGRHRLDDLLMTRFDLLIHLVEVELNELLVVLRSVEERVEVALDDFAHSIEDAHGRTAFRP